MTQIDNSVLMNRYQPYYGWPQGPIRLADPVNGLIRLGISDLMEDFKFSGAFRVPLALDGTEYMFSFAYLKKRFDYKLTYYRKAEKAALDYVSGNELFSYPIKNFTNIYQAEVRYPFDQVRSLRLAAGLRTDELVVLANDQPSLKEPNFKETAVLAAWSMCTTTCSTRPSISSRAPAIRSMGIWWRRSPATATPCSSR